MSRKAAYSITLLLISFGILVGGYFFLLHRKVEQPIIPQEEVLNADFNMDHVVVVNENEVVKAQMEELLSPTPVIARISIPSVGLSLPIYKGIGGRNMWLGACTYWENQVMGKGNYVLLGHNMATESLLFSPLKKLNQEKHELIYLSDTEKEYMYQVEEIVFADRSEFRWVEEPEEKEKSILTLVTCYGGYNTPTRRIVRAKYLGQKLLEESKDF